MKILKCLWHGVLWLRQIIFVLYMAVITVVLASITTLLGFLRLPMRIRLIPAKIWSTLAHWGIFFFLWIHVRIKGRENVPNKPCVYVCKHQSSWETVVFHALLYNACFVLKQELLRIPFFGQGLKAVGSIPIDRKQSFKSFKKILQMGKARLGLGLSIIIFPEGTRVPKGHYPKFHRTAMMLAKSTGAAIVPVAHNSGVCWPNRAGLIKPGRITLCFGEVIASDDFSVDELNQHCYQWINDTVKSLGG
ncbi:lysophospholipid acyltransferase family protein [Facilibium subflavum]|uniref:lysophospholipid acyltransferase family protein n=1 Tax=Facilibium subflavum TaxID=2219058 RepID=UPI000E64E15A|nr:lysophospholipid acyltransferase family protein [Facilibium subflavum]